MTFVYFNTDIVTFPVIMSHSGFARVVAFYDPLVIFTSGYLAASSYS